MALIRTFYLAVLLVAVNDDAYVILAVEVNFGTNRFHVVSYNRRLRMIRRTS